MLMVYGKEKGASRFRAFDMENNCFVNKKIYASIFTDNQREELEAEVASMNKLNPNYQFEIREVR